MPLDSRKLGFRDIANSLGGIMGELNEFTRTVLMAAGWLIVAAIVVLLASFVVSTFF